MWLLERLFATHERNNPRFALQGTLHWIRSLAILCQDSGFDTPDLRGFYVGTARKAHSVDGDTLAFEHLFLAMHNVSSLVRSSGSARPHDDVRSAIVCWYYAIYWASKSMVAAASNADPQTHGKTARVFYDQIVVRGLAKNPFDLHLVDLTPTNIETGIDTLRAGNTNDLNVEPTTVAMAQGAALSYLKGTAKREKEIIEKRVRISAPFVTGGYRDFRTNAAKAIRDAKLNPAVAHFLVSAIRFRGKANYRDALFLAYGTDRSTELATFLTDLALTGMAFTRMAAHYVSRRTHAGDWDEFAGDVFANAVFELPFDLRAI